MLRCLRGVRVARVPVGQCARVGIPLPKLPPVALRSVSLPAPGHKLRSHTYHVLIHSRWRACPGVGRVDASLIRLKSLILQNRGAARGPRAPPLLSIVDKKFRIDVGSVAAVHLGGGAGAIREIRVCADFPSLYSRINFVKSLEG